MIEKIYLDLIKSFENHPFKIDEKDESLIALADSIKMNGLFIRLTYLIPEILEMVDRGYIKPDQNHLTMSVGVAVVVSYLYLDEQKLLYNSMLYEDRTPNLNQAMRIKKLSERKKLNFNSLEQILVEEKANQKETISFNSVYLLIILSNC